MGVESIAVDPNDPDRVYLSCGTYTNETTPNGAILRSGDRGKTFQRTSVPFKMGGNENGRGNGERMRVDPNDGNIIYLGTRQAGLWRSTDRGVTWSRVESFPDVTEPGPPPKPQEWWKRPNGVVFVVFDPHSGSRGKGSSTIYAGASLMGMNNLFRSTDGGRTWQPVEGQPTAYRPIRSALASDGALYITYGTDPGPWGMTDGALWKLDTRTGAWTDITPDKPTTARPFGYAGVSVDAHHPQTVIVSSFYRPVGEEIFRSTDGGSTWKPVFKGGGTYDFSLAPYVARTPIHWLFDIEIDPADSDHALFTTGYGGYETFDLADVDSGKPTRWSVMSTGIEETVALDLLSPPIADLSRSQCTNPRSATTADSYIGIWTSRRPRATTIILTSATPTAWTALGINRRSSYGWARLPAIAAAATSGTRSMAASPGSPRPPHRSGTACWVTSRCRPTEPPGCGLLSTARSASRETGAPPGPSPRAFRTRPASLPIESIL